MTDHPDHVTRLDLCPDCDGLAVSRLNRLDGVESIDIDGLASDSCVIYIGPALTCPNQPVDEEAP